MRNYHVYPVREIAERAVIITRANGLCSPGLIHDSVLYALSCEIRSTRKISKEDALYISDYYISHYPTSDKILHKLCFCKSKLYSSYKCLHMTAVPCNYAETVICINYETLEVSEHRKGECPYTMYYTREEFVALKMEDV